MATKRARVLGLAALTLAAGLACDGGPGSGSSPVVRGERSNVLLISMDTTRADHLGCYGRTAAATPNIDRLAAEGVMFVRCVAPTPLTLPSHSSILTGTDPFVHGVRDNGSFHLHDRNRTLAEALREQGYATGAVLGSYVLNGEFGLGQGFDAYHDVRGERTERTAEEVADLALERLRAFAEGDRPFFLFVHFFDSHAPYVAPARFAGRFAHPYDAEIAYVDEQVGRLLAELDTLGLDRNTLVVLTGDHGESLGQHGEATHSFFIYDSTVTVPLLFRARGPVPAGVRVDSQSRSIDVAPTVLDFVGADGLPEAQGESLLPDFAGNGSAARPAYSETLSPRFNFGCSPLRSWSADGWKYVHAPRPELYDLGSDPGERHDVASDRPELVERMRERLRRWIEDGPVVGPAGDARRGMSDEELDKLRSLGYLASGSPTMVGPDELAAFEPVGPDPKDHVELMSKSAEALGHYRAGDTARAEKILLGLFEDGEAGAEELALAHSLYGTILSGDRRYEEAIEQYGMALRSQPGNGELLTGLGGALVKAGRLDEAMPVLESALKTKPTFAATHVNYGAALAGRNRHAEAAAQYRLALEIDPTLVEAIMGLGASEVAEGLIEQAVTTYERAIEIDPGGSGPRRRQAELLLGLRRSDQALERYRELLRITPEDARAHRGLGLAYMQLGQSEDAVASLLRSVELDPNGTRAWYALAVAQATLGRFDAAVDAAGRALSLAERAGDDGFASRIRARLVEYRGGER